MDEPVESTPHFFPSGAIAFFAVMALFYLGLWLVIYCLMLQRG